MSENEKRLREALAKIAEVAAGAVNSSPAQGNKGVEEQPMYKGQIEEQINVGCTIKSVPSRLQVRAAETAIKINPVNAPAQVLGPFAESAVDLIEPQFLTVLVSKYWGPTPRQLTVSFMDKTPANLRTRILSHMNAWTKTCCISFVETQGTGHVRISRESGGYWFYLGTDILQIPRNRPTMNLEGFTMNTSEGEFTRVVRHETGHTLGFPHEHMRQELIAKIDPQKAYEYFLRTQGWNQRTVDQQVLTPLDKNSIMGTPADQTSIMCYQLPGSITRDGKPIPGGLDINQTDYTFAGKIYPKANRDIIQGDFEQVHLHEMTWEELEDVQEFEIEEALKASTMQQNGAAS